LSSRLFSKKLIKIKICRIVILPIVSYGSETWSLALRKEHRLRVFENKVLRGIFGPERKEMAEVGEGCTMRSFLTCTLHHRLFG
jgi:hypothetical protein